MILNAKNALQLREDFMHIIGSVLPTYNKGKYEVTAILIVPKHLALAHTWAPQDLEDVANDAHVYNPKYKEFYVMCLANFPESKKWAEDIMKERGHPRMYLLDVVLDELKIEFNRMDYLNK